MMMSELTHEERTQILAAIAIGSTATTLMCGLDQVKVVVIVCDEWGKRGYCAATKPHYASQIVKTLEDVIESLRAADPERN